MNSSSADYGLSWSRSDLEQRLGFRGGKFTRVNNLLTFIIGLLLTIVFYASLLFIGQAVNTAAPSAPADSTSETATADTGAAVAKPANRSFGQVIVSAFVDRGPTPYVIVLLFFWSVAILAMKWSKLRLQREALGVTIVPEDHDFVLSPNSVQKVLDNTYLAADNPSHFMLFNRIHVALSNLRNIGRIADVDEILRSQAEHEESMVETSFSLLRGFIWAIPILGFIGTVMGLSSAIGGFGAVLNQANENMEAITSGLQTVTSGLSTAFETTLVALVAALVVQMLLVFQKKHEEEFLDACTEYCLRNVVSRLRVISEHHRETMEVA